MKVLKIFRQSLKALYSNKARSFLTVLGIVIGIASVIALMSLGSGAKEDITRRISTLGTANITVLPGAGVETSGLEGGHPGGRLGGGSQQASTLTVADLDSLRDKIGQAGIKQVSGNVTNSSVFNTSSGEQRFQIVGTSSPFFEMMNLEAERGRLYDEGDVSSGSKTIVLGNDFARDVFGDEDPTGKTLDIGGAQYTVAGVLETVDESGMVNHNIQGYIPNTAARETFGSDDFTSIVVQAESDDSVARAKKEMTGTLLANHGISSKKLADFNVNSSQDLLSTVTSITDILTAFLAGIAGISLLVGGIGIMNIMLVSVTERTREIGLRKAVGAKTVHILVQFLTEALLLTFAGGVLGIIFGQILSGAAGRILDFSTIVTGSSILLAVCVAVAVGVVFGIYPAAKAARLNPIEALRYE